MRWKAASAPRRRSSSPASSAVICAASCCSASRFWRRASSCACCAFECRLCLRVLGLKPRRLLALLGNRLPLGLARILVARGLRLHSSSRRSMRCVSASICFNAAPRLAASLSACRRSSPRVSSCAVSSSIARGQRLRFGFRLRQFCLQPRQPALGLAQIALQRQRTLAGRLAAGHRGAMEALALRREEICVRVAQGQPLRLDGSSTRYPFRSLGRIVSSERPKPFSTLMASRSGVTPGSFTAARRSFEELALRIGVDQECRAPVAGLQQPHALFRVAPALHHHVIQLFAQKLVHHAFVLAAHLKKVRQRAHRRHAWPSAPGFSSRRTVSVE